MRGIVQAAGMAALLAGLLTGAATATAQTRCAVQTACLDRLGAGSAPLEVNCTAVWEKYRQCLVSVVEAGAGAGAGGAPVKAPPVAPPPPAKPGVLLRLGVAGEPAKAKADNECLRAALQKTLGGEVSLWAAADPAQLNEAIAEGKIDMAWLGVTQFADLAIESPKAAVPFLAPTVKGRNHFYTVLLARSDSDARTLSQARGKIVAFPDNHSTAGFLLPSYEFQRLRISLKPGAFFEDVIYAGGYAEAIQAMLDGKADLAVVWTSGAGSKKRGYSFGPLRQLVKAGKLDMGDIKELWRSRPAPMGPVVLRPRLPLHVSKQTVGTLQSLARRDPACMKSAFGGADGFARAKLRDYADVIAARK